MLKHMLCAAVAVGFVAVATVPVKAGPVAPGTPCKEAAKIVYPNDHKARHHYKKSCKYNWKHSQKS